MVIVLRNTWNLIVLEKALHHCTACGAFPQTNAMREKREREKIKVLIQSNSDNDISACEQQKLQNRLEFSGKSEHP